MRRAGIITTAILTVVVAMTGCGVTNTPFPEADMHTTTHERFVFEPITLPFSPRLPHTRPMSSSTRGPSGRSPAPSPITRRWAPTTAGGVTPPSTAQRTSLTQGVDGRVSMMRLRGP